MPSSVYSKSRNSERGPAALVVVVAAWLMTVREKNPYAMYAVWPYWGV
jgi:hypothetical protein